jgi:hypothetical protein
MLSIKNEVQRVKCFKRTIYEINKMRKGNTPLNPLSRGEKCKNPPIKREKMQKFPSLEGKNV